MKSIVWLLIALLILVSILLEFRYVLYVSSPVVAKLDRLTGDAWIVNGGQWRKVTQPTDENPVHAAAPAPAAPKAK